MVSLLKDPNALVDGYRGSQEKLDGENVAIQEQLQLVNNQIEKQQKKLSQLLDLFLEGEFGRAVLEQKRGDIEQALAALTEEQARLEERLSPVCITDEHIRSVEEFARDVWAELANADFALKRRIIEALNIYVTLVVVDGQKMIDLHWYAQTERLCMERRTTGNSPTTMGRVDGS